MWQKVFDGRIEERPVVLKEYDDGDGGRELRVETNYGKDQIIGGDVPGVTAGAPVSADEEMHVDASTPEELEQNLVEQAGFSAAGAKEIARIGRLAWLTDDDDFDEDDDGAQYLASRLVSGVRIAEFDSEIVSGLKTNTVDKWSQYPRMQIAIRNEAGDAYRTIGVDGMGEWIDTLQWFLDQGYRDELGPDGGTWKGCDAVFSKPR